MEGVWWIILFIVLGFTLIPILIGAIALFTLEYCLNFDVNWSWFSMWLFGLAGGLGFLKWGFNND